MRTQPEITPAVGTTPLIARYRGVICDLDGVVYRGRMAVPGAVDTVNQLIADGRGLAFATNNASRPPTSVQRHLRDLGVDGRDWSVITSAQSAAAYLAERLAPRTPVLAVGGPGVAVALAENGLTPVTVPELADNPVEAMVQGLGVDVSWRELAEIAYLAQRGVTWVATNLDRNLPTPDGPAPGNGALVAAVQTATTRSPHVTGKPGPALFELARTTLGTDHARTLVCGDRLDTDIAGANAAQLDSLLVLSGASTLRDLAFARDHERPTYVAADLTGMYAPAVPLSPTPVESGSLTTDGVPHIGTDSHGDPAMRLRAVITTAWAARDKDHVLSRDADAWHTLEQQLGLRSHA